MNVGWGADTIGSRQLACSLAYRRRSLCCGGRHRQSGKVTLSMNRPLFMAVISLSSLNAIENLRLKDKCKNATSTI